MCLSRVLLHCNCQRCSYTGRSWTYDKLTWLLVLADTPTGASHKNSNFRVLLKNKHAKTKDLHSHMATIHKTRKKNFFFTLARALQWPQSSSLLVMLNGWPPSFTFVIAYLNLKEERRQREEHDKRKGGMKYELLKRTYTRLWEEKDSWGLQWKSMKTLLSYWAYFLHNVKTMKAFT